MTDCRTEAANAIRAGLALASNTTEAEAHEAGRSSVIDGPNQTNCHFRYFRTQAFTAAWEQGAAEAAKEKGNG